MALSIFSEPQMRAEGSDQHLNPPTGVANKSACRWGGTWGGVWKSTISSGVTTAEQRWEPSVDADMMERLILMVKDVFQKYWKYFWEVGGGHVPTAFSSLNGRLLTGISSLRTLFPNQDAAKSHTLNLLKLFMTFWTSFERRVQALPPTFSAPSLPVDAKGALSFHDY